MTFCCVSTNAAAGTPLGRSSKEKARASWIFLWRSKEEFAGGLFAIFVPSTDGTSPNGETLSDALLAAAVELGTAQRAVFSMMSLLLRIERESRGRVRICHNVSNIRQRLADGVLAPVLHIEGAEAIDPNFEILDVLYEAGLRSLGPVWSRSNAFGHGVPFRCPSSPDTGPGLTDLGKELIGACNRLRILVDLSHLNERGFWDVAAISNAPLVATHSNAHALSPHSRNLTDIQLAAIRETGGIVGVNFSTSFLRPDGHRDPDTPIELVIEHLEHLFGPPVINTKTIIGRGDHMARPHRFDVSKRAKRRCASVMAGHRTTGKTRMKTNGAITCARSESSFTHSSTPALNLSRTK